MNRYTLLELFNEEYGGNEERFLEDNFHYIMQVDPKILNTFNCLPRYAFVNHPFPTYNFRTKHKGSMSLDEAEFVESLGDEQYADLGLSREDAQFTLVTKKLFDFNVKPICALFAYFIEGLCLKFDLDPEHWVYDYVHDSMMDRELNVSVNVLKSFDYYLPYPEGRSSVENELTEFFEDEGLVIITDKMIISHDYFQGDEAVVTRNVMLNSELLEIDSDFDFSGEDGAYDIEYQNCVFLIASQKNDIEFLDDSPLFLAQGKDYLISSVDSDDFEINFPAYRANALCFQTQIIEALGAKPEKLLEMALDAFFIQDKQKLEGSFTIAVNDEGEFIVTPLCEGKKSKPQNKKTKTSTTPVIDPNKVH